MGESSLLVSEAGAQGERFSCVVTDGRKIALKSDRKIYVVNADGSKHLRLTRTPVEDGSPAWSPDGRKIALCSHERRGQGTLAGEGSGKRSSRQSIQPTIVKPSRSRIGRDMRPAPTVSAGVPDPTAASQRARTSAR